MNKKKNLRTKSWTILALAIALSLGQLTFGTSAYAEKIEKDEKAARFKIASAGDYRTPWIYKGHRGLRSIKPWTKGQEPILPGREEDEPKRTVSAVKDDTSKRGKVGELNGDRQTPWIYHNRGHRKTHIVYKGQEDIHQHVRADKSKGKHHTPRIYHYREFSKY